MARDVRELQVFRRAYVLSLEVHKASLGFPRVEQFGGIADQLRRSSRSICSNLVEGSGRQAVSNVEFRRFVRVAIGSADESRLWCEYARDLGYLPPATAEAWVEAFGEIARMLSGLRRHLSENWQLTTDN